MRTVVPALRFPCRDGRAVVVMDNRPSAELVRIAAVSLSQGQARILEAELVPTFGLVRPLQLLAHNNVLGMRQWAPSSPAEWPAGVMRLRVADLLAGQLYVAVHCELEP